MRADRLLSILLLLQRHGKLPAGELARRLEVSTRTIYRDIEALSTAGVPVYAEQGRGGGVSLVPGYRTDLTGLTASEAQALFLFSGRGPLDELGLGDDLRQALRKLLAAVPAGQRDDVARVSGRFVVDPQSWRRQAEAVPHLSALQEAVLADRRVRIRYPSRRGGGQVRDYVLDPYGLVAKAGVWYLMAAVDPDDAEPVRSPPLVRTFRVSRVQAVEVTGESFERPAGLDVERLWEESRRAFTQGLRAPVPVTARVEQATVEMLRRVGSRYLREGPSPPARGDRDRRRHVRFEFTGPDDAVGTLLSFGAAVEVVEPAEIRERIARTAAATAALYGERCSPAGGR